MQITDLIIYPVKGARGCSLQQASIGPMGLQGETRQMDQGPQQRQRNEIQSFMSAPQSK